MKKRLHHKNASIALLSLLIILSVTEIYIRVGTLRELLLNTTNCGQPVATTLFAALFLVLTFKGKERTAFICYGAWLGYFVLNQFFQLPGIIVDMGVLMYRDGWTVSIGDIALILRICGMISIIVIGALLLEYLDDKTINNRAFNIVCVITVILFLLNIAVSVYDVLNGGNPRILLEISNNLTRLTMVFLFTFFAYDSAKMHVKKINSAK